MRTPKKPTPEQDAAAFMHSMLALVERRGLRYVDEEFGRGMMGMAIWIVTPENGTIDDGGIKDAINAGYTLVEQFPTRPTPDVRGGWRLPVEVLKAAVQMAEVGMRELAAVNNTQAAPEARA
jgi:hypothetical protein